MANGQLRGLDLGGLGQLGQQQQLSQQDRARLMLALAQRQPRTFPLPVQGPSLGAPVFGPGGGANVQFTGGSPFPVDPTADILRNALVLAARVRNARRRQAQQQRQQDENENENGNGRGVPPAKPSPRF